MAPQVNGERPNSVFVDHLFRYPLVSDGVETFKSNRYGQQSLQLGDQAYRTFAQPLVPYLQRPYAYIAPYVRKADSLGDSALSVADEKFPVITKPTGELYNGAKGIAYFPVRKAGEGRDYVLATYSNKLKENESKSSGPVVAHGRAIVATAFAVGYSALEWATSFLGQKKTEAKETARNATN